MGELQLALMSVGFAIVISSRFNCGFYIESIFTISGPINIEETSDAPAQKWHLDQNRETLTGNIPNII